MPLAAAAIAMAAGSATLSSCNSNAKDELAHHHHDHGHEAGHEHSDAEGHDHDAEGKEHAGAIVLEPEQAKFLGVEAQPVKPSAFHKVLKVSGQILESASGASVATAPAAGTVTFAKGINEGSRVSAGTVIAHVRGGRTTGGDPNAAAHARLEAAKKELERIRPLHEHGIVSTADYNAAVAAYNAARAEYSPAAASGAIVAPLSGTVTRLMVKTGEYVDAGAQVASISSGSGLTLRADLPQRHYAVVSEITGAKFRTPYSDNVTDLSALSGSRLQGNMPASSRPGYIPVYFTFSNDGTIVPGTPVEVYLQGAPRKDVITVPMGAVSEQQGRYFVYRKLDEDCYEKLPVTLGENDGEFVEVLDGVRAGDNIVVKGAVAVRLAESSGVVPEGHTHSH